MLIEQILIIAAVILLSRIVLKEQFFKWAFFLFSLAAIFWFQPISAIRKLDFWLPVMTLILTVLSWAVFYSSNFQGEKENMISLVIIFGFFILLLLEKIFGIKFLGEFVSNPGYTALFTAATLVGLAYLSKFIIQRSVN